VDVDKNLSIIFARENVCYASSRVKSALLVVFVSAPDDIPD
jgi:hypothetical protein